MTAVFLLIAAQIICTAALIMCIVQLIPLGFLSKEVHRIIDDVFDRRMAATRSGMSYEETERSIPYPDIDATYDNLRWYTFWRRPSTLVVFEKGQNAY